MKYCSNGPHDEETWWARNRKKVFIASGVSVILTGGVLLIVNRKDVARFFIRHFGGSKLTPANTVTPINEPAAKTTITEATHKAFEVLNNGQPFIVESHFRNLPAGQKASATQRELADSLGLVLGENQTLVRTYYKNIA